jgi:DNA replicative helicase MCM subunit Mcm2 (Cdc46/Mcm family)
MSGPMEGDRGWSKMDLQLINDIKHLEDGNVMRLLVSSICPGIFGHEMVKAGMVLCMFSGVARGGGAHALAIRGDPHMLVVGDPGLGKSQMVRAAAAVHPRGIYVCGTTCSSAGLTVTMVKDPQTGDSALEAGALVLADQGVCCIDEFDKIKAEHANLLEAMEQQTISMAKAGMIVSLSARTSIIAAANPVGGHYDHAKTVCENIKMSPALLSRFDLTFVLLDDPNERRDKELSEHVIGIHTAHRIAVQNARADNGHGTPAAVPATTVPHLRTRSAHAAQEEVPSRRNSFGLALPSQRMMDNCDYGQSDRSPLAGGPTRMKLDQLLCYMEEEVQEVDLLPHECLQKYLSLIQTLVISCQ